MKENMKKKMLALTFLTVFALMPAVYAHCPLCTAAVGTGVAVTRFYGLDDTIAGAWIGGFIVSTALWADRKLKKKHVPLQGFLLTLLALLITIVPLSATGLIWDTSYKIFGVDKLLLGIIAGTLVSPLAIAVSGKIKEKREKVLFPFQTIILTLAALTILSLVFLGITW